MLTHCSASHTRSMYMNQVYINFSVAEVEEMLKSQGKTAPKLINQKGQINEQYLKCPFCIKILQDSNRVSNGHTHHLH
jgi:hypothetical protein